MQSPWTQYFTEKIDDHYGYVSTYAQLQQVISAYEVASVLKFHVSKNKDFHGDISLEEIASKVERNPKRNWFYQEPAPKTTYCQIPFLGHPFLLFGNKTYACQYGGNPPKGAKRKHDETDEEEALPEFLRNPKKKQTMKRRKLGCTAKIHARQVIVIKALEFANTKQNELKCYDKRVASSVLNGMTDVNDWMHEQRIYVRLPTAAEHDVDHELGADVDTVDFRIKLKVEELVKQGIIDTSDVLRRIQTYVEQDLLKDDPDTRKYPRYKPSRKLIFDRIRSEVKKLELKRKSSAVSKCETLERLPSSECEDGERSQTSECENGKRSQISECENGEISQASGCENGERLTKLNCEDKRNPNNISEFNASNRTCSLKFVHPNNHVIYQIK